MHTAAELPERRRRHVRRRDGVSCTCRCKSRFRLCVSCALQLVNAALVLFFGYQLSDEDLGPKYNGPMLMVRAKPQYAGKSGAPSLGVLPPTHHQPFTPGGVALMREPVVDEPQEA